MLTIKNHITGYIAPAEAASAVLLAVFVAGCGSQANDSANGDLALVRSGQLTVCTDAPYKPFEYPDESSPTGYTGFDLDIVGAIAQSMDLHMVVRDEDYDALQSGAALAARQCDIVASAMTITPQREEKLDFSDSYYESLQSLLVRSGSRFDSIDDLAGRKVGVQQGTTGAKFAKTKLPPGAEMVLFPSDGELYAAMESGSLDAVLQDYPVNLEHAKDGTFAVVEQYDTNESYGFAVRERGSEVLLETVNAELRRLRENGRYDEFYDKHFTAVAPAAPQ
jgi:polar amino acid transport system substrate-binding protein